jgi:hypothetical protein
MEDQLRISRYSCLESKDPHARDSLFAWENGCVYRYYCRDNLVKREEFMYIHLQKRRMDNKVNNCSANRFLIKKHSYEDMFAEITPESLIGENTNCLSKEQRTKKVKVFFKHNGHRVKVKIKRFFDK